MLQQPIPLLRHIPVGIRESWLQRLISVIRNLDVNPSEYALFRYFAFCRCTLFFGRRGGRKHRSDLVHEIDRRLALWDIDDIPTLWAEALSFQHSVWYVGGALG